ncbi:hypothetical protein LWI29_012590 [Acer saccharum]|uniref:Uncharacterized protein n=1 Tax=Acer saccharum TaxID=4024 RepID=A0AA39W5C7_ACESA|nr:hypothetical protein LWI29_012590 [Acer saccharum]
MATVGMVVGVRTRNISFSYGGKSVGFKVDRPRGSHEDSCLLLELPKLRKKKSQVFDLVQAFVMMSGRTRNSATQVGQGSERRSRKSTQVPPVPLCVLNSEFEDRLE